MTIDILDRTLCRITARAYLWAELAVYSLIFASVGAFLIHHDVVAPPAPVAEPVQISITATGERHRRSAGSEVWFYGASDQRSGEPVAESEFSFGAGWQRHGEAYLSHGAQPHVVQLMIDAPTTLHFGAHSHSGKLTIDSPSERISLDLYSKDGAQRRVMVNPANNRPYALIAVFFGFGAAFALARRRYPLTADIGISTLALITATYASFAYFYPGTYTPDSADQLNQALREVYSDWHPPIMAAVWSALINATGSPASLFNAHIMLLLLGGLAWVIFLAKAGRSRFALLVPLLLFTPLVTNFSGIVWKDVGFAFSMLLATGLVAIASLHPRLGWVLILLAYLICFYAFGIRSNGVFAIAGLVSVAVWLCLGGTSLGIKPVRRLLTATVATAFLMGSMILGTNATVYGALKADRTYPLQYIQLFDLAGVSTLSGIDLLPDYIRSESHYSFDAMAEAYAVAVNHVGSANLMVFQLPENSPPLFRLNSDPVLQQDLRDAWIGAIFSEPIAYLHHRYNVFSFLMGRPIQIMEGAQSKEMRLLQIGAAADYFPEARHEKGWPARAASERFIESTHRIAQGSHVFLGWFWLAVLSFSAVAAPLLRHSRLLVAHVMLVGTGLLYLLPYIFFAPAADFRYLYWSTIAAALGIILLVAALAGSPTQGLSRAIRSP